MCSVAMGKMGEIDVSWLLVLGCYWFLVVLGSWGGRARLLVKTMLAGFRVWGCPLGYEILPVVFNIICCILLSYHIIVYTNLNYPQQIKVLSEACVNFEVQNNL